MTISQEDLVTPQLTTDGGTLAYDVAGSGPLVVLAHGMGDTRRSYRFVVPELVAAGYRVATLDVRGCGESSTGWTGYARSDIAGDIVALVRHLGGPAVVVGQSISGGAATIAAATAPDDVVGVVELAPFTRRQSMSLLGLVRDADHRRATVQLARVMLGGSLSGWSSYLDVGVATPPADWRDERARLTDELRQPGRMAVLQAMMKTSPAEAGEHLPGVQSPVLVVMGAADPDWTDPAAEGAGIVADLPDGLGRLAVLQGVGHYPHVEAPGELVALMLPFLAEVAPTGPGAAPAAPTSPATDA
ncbi:alpha-beta hydrolase superfamily lysophospholipase [Frigoribacterium sp. PhB160]|uniref:alpha/beta fold hydrolase n=1 Tax=Frigoribacterium sp. PhB160 TaxID=2485192 RepID=UPI000F498CE2|nr:alpha/beta hydrolase [Frigoribacterium sp. PhB160]ROS61371.1 alpha-beta hydrolase superfamily lysophospholipase [Frigoribacterium sp. PhB160]